MNRVGSEQSGSTSTFEWDGFARIPLGGKGSRGRRVHLGGAAWAWNRTWVRLAYLFIDVLLVVFGAILVVWLRFGFWPQFIDAGTLSWIYPGAMSLHVYSAFLLLYTVLIILLCELQDLYRTPPERTAFGDAQAVCKALLLATGLLIVFIFISGNKSISRLVVLGSGAVNAVTMSAWRLWKRKLIQRRVAAGWGARNTVIVGAGKVGRALANIFEENKHLGYSFKGFLDENHHNDPRLLGKMQDLPRIARAHFVDDLFITVPSERELVKQMVVTAREMRLNVKVIPDLYDGMAWHAPLHYLGGFPVMELHSEPIPGPGLWFKRALDVVISALGLVLLGPLFVAIALAIKLESRGPVFYVSPRAGKKGRIFACHKFRTMVADADKRKEELRHRNERNGPFFKILDDPRITRLGRFLRKYSLDELPQLWNVLTGDMSLVGPRPHPLDDYRLYSLEHLRRLDVKPGLTGLWQVTARRDPSFQTNMELDLQYIENWSLRLDATILLKTIPAVLGGHGQ